jgi:hypothetical protein
MAGISGHRIDFAITANIGRAVLATVLCAFEWKIAKVTIIRRTVAIASDFSFSGS